MRLTVFAGALALAATAVPGMALADDPLDPEMQTEEARERDREMIRKLNRDMLAQVQARDALYAAGWRAHREMPQAQTDYHRRLAAWESDQARYAADRQRYDQAMAKWRRDVAACRAGDFTACN